jgi:hypothetical protein
VMIGELGKGVTPYLSAAWTCVHALAEAGVIVPVEEIAGSPDAGDAAWAASATKQPRRRRRLTLAKIAEGATWLAACGFVAPAALSALMLAAGAFGRWPYGFFQLLRIVTCTSGVWLAVTSHRAGCRIWMWGMFAIAALMNPLVPVTLSRAQWAGLDTGAAIVFLACLVRLMLAGGSRLRPALQRRARIAVAYVAIAASATGLVYAALQPSGQHRPTSRFGTHRYPR